MAWSKGLTKETDIRILNNSYSLKKKYSSGEFIHHWLGRDHQEESKNQMSIKRIEYLESNNNHGIKWYEVNGIKVQGTWERDFAERLVDLGIKFERRRLKFLRYRTYTPDFYLVDYNMYVEIKGYLRENDKYKMLLVLNDNEIDLRILTNIEEIRGFNLEDIDTFVKVKNICSFENIDMTLFKDVWTNN